ncbi:hypothetical protein GCM10007989_20330 [Devosia pacifica]|uniref:EF-hand domain-containing protein n=1 Tax=Devosia pacifica TaxID=1335967 RepID=A0A918VS86_9HYPH|nr:hypothetical protein [Devosia pacifica]GHA24601.1 hypothetical protein GCM10007989_20330 [Devosia pacifica]
MKVFTVAVAAMGLTVTGAMAQAAPSFADLDADASGELSYDEMIVGWPEYTQEDFDAADADVSGGISETELTAITGAQESGTGAGLDAETDAVIGVDTGDEEQEGETAGYDEDPDPSIAPESLSEDDDD